MVNTVIFDLDGLLIQSEICYFQAFNRLLGEYGLSITLEEYASDYSGRTVLRNVTMLTQKYHLPIEIQTGIDYIHAIIDEYNQQGIPLHKGVRELLAFLKENDYTIVLGTSSTKEKADKILSIHHLEDYFQYAAYGTEVKNGKPAPDIFLIVACKAHKKPEECLVLEDSENGIMAAVNAKMKVICVPDVKKPSEKYSARTEGIYGSLLEVIDYLKEDRKNGE